MPVTGKGNTMEEKKPQEVKLDVKLSDDVADGAYVNLAVINHNESEFVVDFLFVQPQTPKANVRSRVIVSPKNAKRLMAALHESIGKYEQSFGAIAPVVQPVDASVEGYH